MDNLFDIAKSYVNIIPIDIVGLIDPNYIECYHKTIIPLEVLFFIMLISVSINILVD